MRSTMLCCFLLLAMTPRLHAEESTNMITRETVGSGMTIEEAVANALVMAIQQIEGVSISASQSLKTEMVDIFSQKGAEGTEHIRFSSRHQEKIQTVTNGVIHSYEMTGEPVKRDEYWEVRLRVNVADYETPGISPDSRRRMAVLPVRSRQASYWFLGERMAGERLTDMLGEKINSRFTQTRRFTMLDRAHIDAYASEKSLILSGDAPIVEQAKLGQALGTDYMVVPILHDLSADARHYHIALTGERGSRVSALIKLDFRIIVMATRQVKWADSVSIALDDAEIRRLIRIPEASMLVDLLLDMAAEQLVNRSVDNIYPLRVAHAEADGTFVIGQGGLSLREGQLLEVFALGPEVHDQYSGESLGAVERGIGLARIERVEAKLSYARLLEGDPRVVQSGMICRRVWIRDDPIPSAPSGGVVLPFDR